MIDISRHPWMSGLFGDKEISDIFSPKAELQRYLRIEAAWTRALGQVEGKAAAAEKIAVEIEAASIDLDLLKTGFANDGVVIPSLVKELRKQHSAEDSVLVHTGLTSQDVVDTALVLALVDHTQVLQRRLKKLGEVISELDARFGKNSITAFTRMQPALETTVSQSVLLWSRPLHGLIVELPNVLSDVSVIQWGGPIGERRHLEAAKLAGAFGAALGLKDPGYAWHTDRTRIVNFGNFLLRASICTGKIAEDIALWAAASPKEISLVGGASSAMPHKNNPVIAEASIALSDYLATLGAGLTKSAIHEGHRSGSRWSTEWLILPQMCIATGAALKQAVRMLESIERLGV